MDIDTILLDTEDRMEKAMAALERDFQKLRTGRATTALVDGIKADYYGTPTPISQMASVAVPDSRTITIQPWDKGGISVVEKAILKSDLGLTPVNDGKIIRISIPPLTEDRRKQLDLPMMVENNTSAYGTGFTVTIEAAEGVTTGVSAADRVTTVRAAIADGAKPSDLNRPGHVFPLRAQPGGVMTRGGHTEATIDLVTLAGFKPAGVLCELTNDDGSMARAPECIKFAQQHNMAVVTIEDLVAYRREHDRKAS